jgi:hypothetical protein
MDRFQDGNARLTTGSPRLPWSPPSRTAVAWVLSWWTGLAGAAPMCRGAARHRPPRPEAPPEASLGAPPAMPPARPFPPSIFLDKNRRDIGKSQSIWTDSKTETAGSPAVARAPDRRARASPAERSPRPRQPSGPVVAPSARPPAAPEPPPLPHPSRRRLLLARRARNPSGTATQCTRRNDSPPRGPLAAAATRRAPLPPVATVRWHHSSSSSSSSRRSTLSAAVAPEIPTLPKAEAKIPAPAWQRDHLSKTASY